MCFMGNAVADLIIIYVTILFNTTGQSLWVNNKNAKSDQLVLV